MNESTSEAQARGALPSTVSPRPWGIFLVLLAPSLGAFLVGYDAGSNPFVLTFFEGLHRQHRLHHGGQHEGTVQGQHEREYWCCPTWWELVRSNAQSSPLVDMFASAFLPLGALLGCAAAYSITDRYGRRAELRISAGCLLLGATWNTLAWGTTQSLGMWLSSVPHGDWIGAVTFIVGRVVFGAGIGLAVNGGILYVAEMAPISIRGGMVAGWEAAAVAGWAAGSAVGNLVLSNDDNPGNWTRVYAVTLPLSLAMLLLTIPVPQSIRWLILRDESDEALSSHQFVLRGYQVPIQFRKIEPQMRAELHRTASHDWYGRHCKSKPKHKKGGSWSPMSDGSADIKAVEEPIGNSNDVDEADADVDDHDHESYLKLYSKAYHGALRIALGLITLRQLSGQQVLLHFAASAVASEPQNPNAAAWLVAFVPLAGALAAVTLVDRVGRKRVLYLGCSLTAVAMATLAFVFCGSDAGPAEVSGGGIVDASTSVRIPPMDPGRRTLVLAATLIGLAGHAVGLGPVTWVVLVEAFPVTIRGRAVAIGVALDFILGFSLVRLLVVTEIGLSGAFAIFALISACSICFVLVRVPETKCLLLEDAAHLIGTGEVYAQSCSSSTVQNGSEVHQSVVVEAPTEKDSLINGEVRRYTHM